MKPTRRLINLFLGFVVAAATAVQAQTVSVDSIDAAIRRIMKDWKVPGLAVAVVKDDTLFMARGYGVRELGKTDPVDEHTLFAVASNTKAFTASLVGILVDEGKLSWDDRVVDRIPEFQMFDPYVTREMTIRDCLTHRSGLSTFGGDHLWIGSPLTGNEIIARLRFLEPKTPFRTRYQYQNLMFLVAGEAAARVFGRNWNDLIEEKFFQPLGMDESNTSVRDLSGLKNVALPHETVDNRIQPVDFDWVDAIAPAAGINSNVLDMARWMRFHLNNGQWKGKTILSSRTVREMQTVQFPIPVSPFSETSTGAHFSGYGLGWFLSEYRGFKIVSHGGGLSGMISLQTLFPEKKLGVVVLSNYAPDSPTHVITRMIADRFLGLETRDWNTEILRQLALALDNEQTEEKALQDKRVKNTRPSHRLEEYVGTYTSALSGRSAVRLEGGKLVFDYNPRHIGEMEHWHYDTFRVTWRHPIFDMPAKSFLTFRTDEAGRISGLEVSFYDPQTFAKVPKP